MYDGALVASNGSDSMVVPVAVTVGATATQDASGNITQALTFGDTNLPRTSRSQSNQLYNNGSFFGANDWTWRQESGDWRFFYFNVPNSTPDGTLFLTDTSGPTQGRSPISTRCCSGRRSGFCQLVCDTVGTRSTRSAGARTPTSVAALEVRHRHRRQRGHLGCAGIGRHARGRRARRRLPGRQVRRAVHDHGRNCDRVPVARRADRRPPDRARST